MQTPPNDASIAVVRYHERTKHRLERYAASLGYLDWDTQPDPFRRFDGAPKILLQEIPPPASADQPTLEAIDREGGLTPAAMNATSIAELLYDSLAISAWKAIETHKWALRCNPSSGNLHPTEGYLVLPAVDSSSERDRIGDTPGLWHYRPLDHSLELRRPIPPDLFSRLLPDLAPGAFLIGLTSIFWREAWKYGERAFRYCQHDAGHAIAAVAYAAAALGWRVSLLDACSDDLVALLLAIDDQEGIEAEHPDALLLVEPADRDDRAVGFRIDAGALAEVAARPSLGARNVLSPDHVEWGAIDAVAEATRKPATLPFAPTAPTAPTTARLDTPPSPRHPLARELFRQRRSAVAFDGKTGISRDAFFALCVRLMPSLQRVPFSSFAHAPAIHPVFFVNRVAGLAPGLYALPRSAEGEAAMRAGFRPRFEFARPEGCPPELPLLRLEAGDVRGGAQMVACNQDIASDGAFAVALLAEFEPRLAMHGPWFYRWLHFEAGSIGQVIYLEAEALGIRGTGIGCFFDDLMHDLVGLRGRSLQTIYHFAVGAPVDDPRLQTLPAYDPSR